MNKIVICCSVRYLEQVSILVEKLRSSLKYRNTEFIIPSNVPYPFTTDPLEKFANRQYYYIQIDTSSEVWVYNNSHVGLATFGEITYALAKNKMVSLLFYPPIEPLEVVALVVARAIDVKPIEDLEVMMLNE